MQSECITGMVEYDGNRVMGHSGSYRFMVLPEAQSWNERRTRCDLSPCYARRGAANMTPRLHVGLAGHKEGSTYGHGTAIHVVDSGAAKQRIVVPKTDRMVVKIAPTYPVGIVHGGHLQRAK
jgi:hypothetical protein